MGQIRPDLFCSKGEDRCNQTGDCAENAVHGGLCSTALQRILLLAVQAILDDVQIEVGQIGGAEVVDGMEYDVEIECLIALVYLFDDTV